MRETTGLWMGLIATGMSSYWIGPYFPCAWFVAILIYEHFSNSLIDVFVNKHAKTDRNKARRGAVGLTFCAGVLYTFGYAPAYFSGKPGTELFAVAWVACAIINALVYSRPDRWILVANLAPGLVTVGLGSFLIHGWGVTPFLAGLSLARLGLSATVGHRDRMLLLADVKLNRSQRNAADQANAAKSEFLATMSHELRTPLNAIIGYSEILEEELIDADKAPLAADASRIQRAGRSLLVLINEVLDFSKIESGKLELSESAIDVAALLRQAVETCTPIAQASHTSIELVVSNDLGGITLDGGRLSQCVLNLLSNACKFTQNGSVVVRSHVEVGSDKDTLVIAVTDTGVGIAPDQAQRLFQPFVQADSSKTRAHEGTGLGLVITKRLAQLMGGDVSMESTPGVGSCFTLRVEAKRPYVHQALTSQAA